MTKTTKRLLSVAAALFVVTSITLLAVDVVPTRWRSLRVTVTTTAQSVSVGYPCYGWRFRNMNTNGHSLAVNLNGATATWVGTNDDYTDQMVLVAGQEISVESYKPQFLTFSVVASNAAGEDLLYNAVCMDY